MTAPMSRDTAPAGSFESVYGVRRGWIDAIVACTVGMFPVFGVLLALADTHAATFTAMRQKVGPVGLPYTISFVLAAVLAERLAFDARRHGAPRHVFRWYALLGLWCFFVAGEHVSWGQAIVPYHTPFGYGHVNKFHAFNLHNLPVVDDLHEVFLLICGVAGLIGIRMASRPRTRFVGVPPALAPIVWTITGMVVLQIVCNIVYVPPLLGLIVFVFRYAIEFAIGITCLTTVWLNGRGLRRAWAAEAAGH